MALGPKAALASMARGPMAGRPPALLVQWRLMPHGAKWHVAHAGHVAHVAHSLAAEALCPTSKLAAQAAHGLRAAHDMMSQTRNGHDLASVALACTAHATHCHHTLSLGLSLESAKATDATHGALHGHSLESAMAIH